MAVLRSMDLCIAGLKWLRSGPRYFDLSVVWCRYLGYNSVGRCNGLCVQIWRWSPSTYEPESAKGGLLMEFRGLIFLIWRGGLTIFSQIWRGGVPPLTSEGIKDLE